MHRNGHHGKHGSHKSFSDYDQTPKKQDKMLGQFQDVMWQIKKIAEK
jgi:hypothetical protein